MNDFVENRAKILGEYIAKQKSTVRQTAKVFGISKSTVHKDVSQRLRFYDKDLYNEVKEVLEQNKNERHIRGGMATKEKYLKLSKNNDAKAID